MFQRPLPNLGGVGERFKGRPIAKGLEAPVVRSCVEGPWISVFCGGASRSGEVWGGGLSEGPGPDTRYHSHDCPVCFLTGRIPRTARLAGEWGMGKGLQGPAPTHSLIFAKPCAFGTHFRGLSVAYCELETAIYAMDLCLWFVVSDI